MKAYGADAVKTSTVRRWVRRLGGGDGDIDDKARSGCPSTAKTSEIEARLDELIHADRRRTANEMCVSSIQESDTSHFSEYCAVCTHYFNPTLHAFHSRHPPIVANDFIEALHTLPGGGFVWTFRAHFVIYISVSAPKQADPSPYRACIDRVCPVDLRQASMTVDGPFPSPCRNSITHICC